jgi:hypothetical protein
MLERIPSGMPTKVEAIHDLYRHIHPKACLILGVE